MVSVPSRPARARSAAEKHQRRDDILRAAERLWTTTSYIELSMNHVAREAGLAKGTLYLYFDTKEELFLALASEYLHAWIGEVVTQLRATPPRSPEAVADVLLGASADTAPLRRLLVLLGTVLERNVRPELTRQFRQELDARLGTLVAVLPFRPATSLRLLRHLYALAIGWQQLSEGLGAGGHRDAPDGAHCAAPDALGEEFELATRAILARLAAEDAPASRA